MRLIFGRLCQTHEDTAVEHMGCCGCGGFWQTNVKVLRKREEVEASHHKKGDAGTGASIWDERQLSLTFIVWDSAVSNYRKKKKCLSQHAPNTMNFDGRDLE